MFFSGVKREVLQMLLENNWAYMVEFTIHVEREYFEEMKKGNVDKLKFRLALLSFLDSIVTDVACYSKPQKAAMLSELIIDLRYSLFDAFSKEAGLSVAQVGSQYIAIESCFNACLGIGGKVENFMSMTIINESNNALEIKERFLETLPKLFEQVKFSVNKERPHSLRTR